MNYSEGFEFEISWHKYREGWNEVLNVWTF
jgi:hypothetical protein